MTLLRINNRILKRNGTLLTGAGGEPPAPGLPPYTIRLKFRDGVTPTFSKGTGVQVSSSPNIWDLTYNNANWTGLLYEQSDLLEVIDANTTGVMRMGSMLRDCSALMSVHLFDTSSVTDMSGMFNKCAHLTSVPLFDTSKVTNMKYMFNGCYDVQSGALALYRQASSQATPPSNHSKAFTGCGANTTTGRAELDQIPQDWGGNALPDDLPID